MSSALVAALLCAGCASVVLAPPRLHERVGARPATKMARVVALPATCGNLNPDFVPDGEQLVPIPAQCPPGFVEAADAAVRAELAFRGLHVIDSETLNAATASRRETITRTETMRTDGKWTTHSVDTSTSIERTVLRFDDVSPIDQRAILRELRAHGLLTTRIFIGAPLGMSDRRTVHVQVRLLAAGDFALVWSRRCDLEVGDPFASDGQVIERGTRCAMERA